MCLLVSLPRDWVPFETSLNEPSFESPYYFFLQIVKVEESKRLAHVYLFTTKSFHDPSHSLNHQLANSDLWKNQDDVFLSSQGSLKSPTRTTSLDTPPKAPTTTPTPSTATSSPSTNRTGKPSHPPKGLEPHLGSCSTLSGSLTLPPVLDLPQIGQNMDIYVSVACHPGHFVLQPWQDMYKLVILMEEMILYYSKTDEKPVTVEKNQVYAAKVENKWVVRSVTLINSVAEVTHVQNIRISYTFFIIQNV